MGLSCSIKTYKIFPSWSVIAKRKHIVLFIPFATRRIQTPILINMRSLHFGDVNNGNSIWYAVRANVTWDGRDGDG
jgi:hypothetical protein